MKKNILLFALLILCGGCATSNSFTEFYTTVHTPEEVQKYSEYIETCTEPKVGAMSPTEGIEELQNRMFEKGYTLIGYSSFEASDNQGEKEALLQGQEIGACMVLWKAEYERTENTSHTMPTYTPGTTLIITHYGIFDLGGAYGRHRGFSNRYYSGSAQYTVSKDLYSYVGTYFAKVINSQQALMLTTAEAPLSYMKHTDSRKGALVKSVLIDGNAYKANIFKGDIIVSINGKEVTKDSMPKEFLKSGAKNKIVLYRNGEIITKNIVLPPVS